MGVELRDGLTIGRQRRGQIGAFPDPSNALFMLGGLACVLTFERVTAPTRMGIDVMPRLVLAIEVGQQFEHNAMFEDIGVTARVVSVTVTEHEGFPVADSMLALPSPKGRGPACAAHANSSTDQPHPQPAAIVSHSVRHSLQRLAHLL